MNCNAPDCRASSQNHLWKCSGTCGQSFHAACIGAKRDWEDNLRNYVLPLCQQCAKSFLEVVDLRQILNKQMECQHKIINQLKGITIMQDAVEAIEKRMATFEQHWHEGAKRSKTIMDTLAALPKQTSSADTTDLVLEAIRECSMTSANSINAKIDETKNHIVEKMECDQKDLLAIASTSGNIPSDMILEIMDEVKLLSAMHSRAEGIISAKQINSIFEDPAQSLAEEMADDLVSARSQQPVSQEEEGETRVFPNEIVWRKDWSEYDARKLRKLQEKAKEQANNRMKRRYSRNKINNRQKNQGTINSNTHNAHFNRTQLSRNHHNNNTVQFNQHSSSSLPLDKDLLAAAKEQFSRPPGNHQGIRFQRGEILNPYPADKQSTQISSASASNWTYGPALRNSFSNHCVSCSCQRAGF